MTDKDIIKAQTRLQVGISTNILVKMGKDEPVAMESLAKITTALNCGLDDIIERNSEQLNFAFKKAVEK